MTDDELDEDVRTAYRAGLRIDELAGIYRLSRFEVEKIVEGIRPDKRKG